MRDYVMKYVEEDVAKSPGSSSTSPLFGSVSSNKPLAPDSGSTNAADAVAPVAATAVAVAVVTAPKTSTAEEPKSPTSSLLNGNSSGSPPPSVNGIAPVRHENGSNKNLTVEIDIPPGMNRRTTIDHAIGYGFLFYFLFFIRPNRFVVFVFVLSFITTFNYCEISRHNGNLPI